MLTNGCRSVRILKRLTKRQKELDVKRILRIVDLEASRAIERVNRSQA